MGVIYMEEMYSNLESLSFKEILGYSIEAESKASEFYNTIADSLSELMAQRYRSLASDEDMHKRKLLNLHDTYFGDKEHIVPEKEGLPPHEGDVKADTVSNLIDSLNKAIENERNSYKIYKYLSKNKTEHSKMFEYLALMEHGHLQSLQAEKEIYEEGEEAQPELRGMDPNEWDKFQIEKWGID